MRAIVVSVVSCIAITGAWSHTALCQQAPATQGSTPTEPALDGSGQSAIDQPSAAPDNTNPLGTAANQGAQPGQTGTAGAPQQQPMGTGTRGSTAGEGAQPGQTGTAEALQRGALDQQRQQQLRTERQFNDQQLLDQEQRLNQRRGLNQLDGFGGERSFRDQGPNDTTRFGITRQFDRQSLAEALQRRGHVVEDWRLVEHNSRWWYWTPDRSWHYFTDGDWVAYRPDLRDRGRVLPRRGVNYPAGYPAEDWRLVQHNGRWWFWTPDQTWLYLDSGRWNRFPERGLARDRDLPRYGVGYRGGYDRFEGPRQGQQSLDGFRDGQRIEREGRGVAPERTLDQRAPIDQQRMEQYGEEQALTPSPERQWPSQDETESFDPQSEQLDRSSGPTEQGTEEAGMDEINPDATESQSAPVDSSPSDETD